MKQVIRACIALAAFAALAVVPATASATNDPLLTQPTGTTLAPTHAAPIPVVGTNVGATVMTDSEKNVLTECGTAVLKGNLETNTGTGPGTGVVEGTITSASFFGTPGNHASEHCKGSAGNTVVTTNPATNGLNWCLRSTTSMATDEFQVRGNGCTSASRPIRFTLHITTIFGKITCTYQRSAAIPGTYTTHEQAAKMTINQVEFPLLEGSGLCPSKGFLDMAFNLYRESGGKHLENPIYIDNQ